MISINCTTEDHLELDQLTEFQGGLKNRTEADYAKIIVSIQKYGFSFPFFVWAHDEINHVLDGHGRLGALQRLKDQGETIPPLPVVYVSCGNEENAKNLLLRLNSQYGQMTAESVMDFMAGLEFDPAELALPEGLLDLNLDEKEHVEDDDVPEPETDLPPISKPGEIYQLGPHALMCGDSTKVEDLEKLMAGAKADLVVTDPPYNVNYGAKGKTYKEHGGYGCGMDDRTIMNDNMDDSAFLQFLTDAFKAMFAVLKAGGAYYVWHSDTEGYNFRLALKNTGGTVKQCLIWVKNSLVLGRQDWQWRHEPCLYGWKEGSAHYWDGRRDLTTVLDKRPDYKRMDKNQLLQEIEKLRAENIPSTIIYEDRPTRSEDHPTMKPVKLFMRLIKNSSKEEDIVLDPFGGSGTTIIASQRLKRVARVMELDPHYCDVIRRRWTKWAKENNLEPGEGALE